MFGDRFTGDLARLRAIGLRGLGDERAEASLIDSDSEEKSPMGTKTSYP